jgi:hypothetical protein
MMVFVLLMIVGVVFSTIWVAKQVRGRWDPAGEPGRPRPADARPTRPVVPLDDAPPGVLDAIVAELRRPDHT